MEKSEHSSVYKNEETHWWYKGMRDIAFSLLNREYARVLDAGCGTGINLIKLRKYGNSDGIDISKIAVGFCKERELKNVTVSSVERIPFKDNTFDLVTSFEVICCKEVKDESKALNEFWRVLKPDGKLLIRLPARKELFRAHDKFVHSVRRYNKKDIKKLLESSNFKIERITYLNMACYLPLLIVTQISKHIKPKSDIKRTNPLLNLMFYKYLLFEKLIVRFINLPIGTNLIIKAVKRSRG